MFTYREDAFRQWLSLHEGDTVGRSRMPFRCPLSLFLSERYGSPVMVDGAQSHELLAEGGVKSRPLAGWMIRFVRWSDRTKLRSTTPISGNRALQIMTAISAGN